jgi:hypothetical protein
MYKISFALFLIGCFLSCAPRVKNNLTSKEADNPAFFLEKANFVPDWMEGRCQIQVESENMNLNGQAILRIRKDSAIWISVRKLGFEVGRALILKDSFFYMDRINNRFQSFPVSFLREKYQLPGDFYYLQAMLLGNAPHANQFDFDIVKKESAIWQLQQINQDDIHTLAWDAENKRIASFGCEQPISGKLFTMMLGDYKALESNQQFSYFRDLNIQSAETGKLHVVLSFNQVQINIPLSLRFDIPQRYSGSN